MNDNQVNNNIQRSNERKGRGLFYGIVALAVFIIMVVGATYAFFSATTQTTENPVSTKSATLELEYLNYGSAWNSIETVQEIKIPKDPTQPEDTTENNITTETITIKEGLVPATLAVAQYAFENQNDSTLGYNRLDGGNPPETLGKHDNKNNILCKDDEGRSVCSVYVFQLRTKSNGEQKVSVELESSTNYFTNLKAMFYKIEAPAEGTADYTDYSQESTNDPEWINNVTFQVPTRKIPVTDNNNVLQPVGTYTPVYLNRKGVIKTQLGYDVEGESEQSPSENIDVTSGTRAKLADGVEINENWTTYAIVLYINETGSDQTNQDGNNKEFAGNVIISSGKGIEDGVTGKIGLMTPETPAP